MGQSDMPKNYEITVKGRDGARVTADVHLKETIPAGGIHLEVVYDLDKKDVVSVNPWRKIGRHVLDAVGSAAG